MIGRLLLGMALSMASVSAAQAQVQYQVVSIMDDEFFAALDLKSIRKSGDFLNAWMVIHHRGKAIMDNYRASYLIEFDCPARRMRFMSSLTDYANGDSTSRREPTASFDIPPETAIDFGRRVVCDGDNLNNSELFYSFQELDEAAERFFATGEW